MNTKENRILSFAYKILILGAAIGMIIHLLLKYFNVNLKDQAFFFSAMVALFAPAIAAVITGMFFIKREWKYSAGSFLLAMLIFSVYILNL